MLNKRFLVTLVFSITSFFLFGQHIHDKSCGVSAEDQLLAEMLHPNDFRGDVSSLRNNTVYIPVKFHLTANDDGSGRIDYNHVFNQLCILNEEYAASNMVFYIYEGFSLINQTNIYQSAGTNRNAVQAKKDGKAVNIFITQNANLDNNTSGGTTLGFYSPQGDYIVVRRQELVNQTNTLSHEIGHFFNLRHTFYGWEGAPYNRQTHGQTVTFTTVPGGIPNITVELMDGSNCATAADLICDTPPDYNFGLGASSCNFNTVVFDKNNDRVIPMTDNQMGYFLSCDSYRFTDGQINRMLTNYNSSSRNYLRSNYIPNVSEITTPVVLNFPKSNDTLQVLENVVFDWQDVPGASNYLIEIKGSNQNFSAITTESEYILPSLRRNSIYSYSVRPFNEGFGCAQATSLVFRTGAGVSSTYDIAEINNVVIAPNPISDASNAQILLYSNDAVYAEFEVLTLIGQRVSKFSHPLELGQNSIPFDTKQLNVGIHILNIKVNGRSSFVKFVVQ